MSFFQWEWYSAYLIVFIFKNNSTLTYNVGLQTYKLTDYAFRRVWREKTREETLTMWSLFMLTWQFVFSFALTALTLWAIVLKQANMNNAHDLVTSVMYSWSKCGYWQCYLILQYIVLIVVICQNDGLPSYLSIILKKIQSMTENIQLTQPLIPMTILELTQCEETGLNSLQLCVCRCLKSSRIVYSIKSTLTLHKF